MVFESRAVMEKQRSLRASRRRIYTDAYMYKHSRSKETIENNIQLEFNKTQQRGEKVDDKTETSGFR